MLIPSIDLMGGKIVQLIQGSKKALETTDFEAWIERFSRYPLVQLIDLDAAMGKGGNRALVEQFAARLPCQVGGGIRSIAAAEDMLRSGARRIIIGSALVRDGRIPPGIQDLPGMDRFNGGHRRLLACGLCRGPGSGRTLSSPSLEPNGALILGAQATPGAGRSNARSRLGHRAPSGIRA